MTYKEENNYPKAIAISTGIMVFLLAISFFIVIGSFQPPEEVGMGGMVVNYGTAETGMGDDYTSIEEPSADPNANNKAPDKVVPEEKVTPTTSVQSSDKEIQTQNTEDAISVNTKKTKPTTATPTPTTEDKPSKPVINQNALYKGKKNTGQGQGDGTGNTPGNQGSVNGDPLANNYGEGGSGNGNVQLTLASRRFVNIPRIQDDGQSAGKIAVQIRVDKNGTVVFARAGAKGTTLSDLALWRKCEQAVLGASLNKLESAPDVQIGVVMFNFKVK
ncbi:energy transducer TonB [Pedobacter punctiformis]|uniref:Energy transducer TonB n=1 Tax=Pedobacter punctiformis TaxID=3004097 RepID=A0ABT4L9Y9_9SPHI|nr:energy transducer TonB [Pedobacter sp. HCMS5-2]MCZ4244741.1 energy transducer TonB [Pedobacter sp. HCMS5-2]